MVVSIKLIIFFATILCGYSTAQTVAKIGDREVKVFKSEEVFVNAHKICRSHGMQLLMVENYQKDVESSDLAQTFGLKKFWIGGHRVGGQWIWLPTGNPITYLAWRQPTEPDSVAGRDCIAHFFEGRANMWANVRCDNANAFICEETDLNITLKEDQRKLMDLKTKGLQIQLEVRDQMVKELHLSHSDLQYQLSRKDQRINEMRTKQIDLEDALIDKEKKITQMLAVETELRGQLKEFKQGNLNKVETKNHVNDDDLFCMNKSAVVVIGLFLLTIIVVLAWKILGSGSTIPYIPPWDFFYKK